MITQAELKLHLSYNPITGIFTRIKDGCAVGCLDKKYGYVKIFFEGKHYVAHRLAWFYMNGEFPKLNLDHIDTVRNNNIWTNLREATYSENACNVGIRNTNKSGFKGVSWAKAASKWYAHGKLNGKSKHLGGFDTKEEAFEAYRVFAVANHGEFYRV